MARKLFILDLFLDKGKSMEVFKQENDTERSIYNAHYDEDKRKKSRGQASNNQSGQGITS